jgi:hypothetical protein
MQASSDALCPVCCIAGKLLFRLISLGIGFPDLCVLQGEPLLRGGDRLHDHWDLPRGHCRPGHPDALREKEGLHPHARQVLNCKEGCGSK